MRKYCLNIAGYKIRFECLSDGLELKPGERFLRNFCTSDDADVTIRIYQGKYDLPRGTVKVFSAPYVEEINGMPVKKSDKFWSVHKNKDELFIRTGFPLSPVRKNAVLKFSLTERNWELWINNAGEETDPLEYPLDGLILYYLTVIHEDIMLHASGVNNAGRGYLFSGVSGRGKTTIATLWDNAGAKVIHDDRLILRKNHSGYTMHNTPVYKNDVPSESRLDKIFLIGHGKKNEILPVSGASAVSLVMANCIQHNWDPQIIARLLGSVSKMCAAVPVARLLFIPDKSIIDYILENE
jgi:hypothetical protein